MKTISTYKKISMITSKIYLYHIFFLQAAVMALPSEFISDKIIPVMQKCYKDPVPNVRIVILKIFKSMGTIISDKDKGTIKS